MQLLTKTTTL